MSGHESHGHGGGHGDHGHAIPKAPPMEPTTDSKTIERRALIHKLDDADAGARGRILSGTLSPEADAVARKTILENREKRADILDEEKKANEFVKNLIERKKSLKTKIDNLHKNINEYKYRDGFKDALQHELDIAHNDLREVQENIENNTKNVQDHKLKENLDNTRKEYLAEYEKHAKNLKNKVAIKNVKTRLSNIYQSTANIFRKEDSKKKLKGYKSVETYGDKNLREKRALYDDARVLLAQNMYERKEEELNASGIEASEQIKKLKYYKATEIIQKVYVEEKAKTREAISSLERTKLDRLGLWYSKQPRWKKVALGTALFVGGGSAFAASMIAKYGIGWCIAGKFATSYGVGYATNTATGKVIDRIHKTGDKDFRNSINNDKLDLSSNFTRGDTNMTLLEYERQLSIIERREQEKLQKRMSAKMWAGLGLGIGAGALTYNLMADCTPQTAQEIPVTKGHTFTNPDQTEKTIPDTENAPVTPEPTPTPEQPAPANPESGQEYKPYDILPRESAGPEIDMNPNRARLERGGPAITSDFTPHITDDGTGPTYSNIEDQAPAAEKPGYNMGDYDPTNRDIQEVDPRTGGVITDNGETPKVDSSDPDAGKELKIDKDSESKTPTQEKNEGGEEMKINSTEPKGSTSPENTNTESDINQSIEKPKLKISFEETQKIQAEQLQNVKVKLGDNEYNKITKEMESKNIPYKSDSTALRAIGAGEHSDQMVAYKLAMAEAQENILSQTGQTQIEMGNSNILDTRTYRLPDGGYRSVIVFETEKVNGQDVGEILNTEKSSTTEVQESTVNGEEMKINPQETSGSAETPNIESETNLAIENIIKEGRYKDIVKNVEKLGYEFEGSRSADVTVLKFLESYKSGEYTLAIDSADAPTQNLASQAISQRQGLVNTAEKMNLWKKTDSGYHMISIRLIKK